jgi:hypothetical protein
VLSTRPNSTEADIDELMAGRMERQAVLTREEPPPPLLWVLLDEGVLHRPVAPPSVMHDQLFYLNEASRLPNVTVNVVPYAPGGHSGLLCAFIIAELGEAAVKTHVGRILARLGLRDRVRAVVMAYEAGLVRARSAR